MPNAGDHLLAALIAVAYPLYFILDWKRRARPRLMTGGSRARRRFYRRSMIELWLLTPVVLIWWLWSGRAIAGLGLGVPGGRAFWIGVVVLAVIVAALVYQVAAVRASAEARSQVRKQFSGDPALILPRDGRERRIWVGLGLTAGFCEEILYRGFLIWYAMTWLPGVIAVPVSAVVFGAAHIYLGWDIGVFRATIAGVIFGVAYLLTGSLWAPIVLHAVIDITSGFAGSAVLEDDAP